MSRHFAFSQVIAIGQAIMPSARQFQLRTPAIDVIARFSDERLPVQNAPELELLHFLNQLTQLGESTVLTFGTPSQRLAWASFWHMNADELTKHLRSYMELDTKLSFTDWLSRQSVLETVWQFLSMSIRALSTAKQPALVSSEPVNQSQQPNPQTASFNDPRPAIQPIVLIMIQ